MTENALDHIEGYIRNKIGQLDRFLMNLSQKRYWVLRLAILLWGIAFVFSPPKFYHFSSDSAFDPPGWEAVDYQLDHFLEPMQFQRSLHQAKRVFRLTIPFLGVTTGIKSAEFWAALQIFAGILFFYLLLRISLNITGFSLDTLYFSIGLVGVFFASACISDTGYRYDGFSFLFLLAAMFFRQPIVLFFLTILISFCDERAFMACSLVFLWWLFQYLFKKIDNYYPLIAVMLGMFTYLGLRFFITYQYNLSIPEDDTQGMGLVPLKRNLHYIPFGLFATFELSWFFILIGMFLLYLKRQFIPLILWIGAMAVMTVVSFLVYDITSSLSYTFPSILIGFLILYQYTEFKGMKKYFLLTGAGSILFPTYWLAMTPWYYFPLPFIILQWLLSFLA